MNALHLAEHMPLYDYEELLWHWNEGQSTNGDDIEAPDPAKALPMIDMVNADPRLTH